MQSQGDPHTQISPTVPGGLKADWASSPLCHLWGRRGTARCPLPGKGTGWRKCSEAWQVGGPWSVSWITPFFCYWGSRGPEKRQMDVPLHQKRTFICELEKHIAEQSKGSSTGWMITFIMYLICDTVQASSCVRTIKKCPNPPDFIWQVKISEISDYITKEQKLWKNSRLDLRRWTGWEEKVD